LGVGHGSALTSEGALLTLRARYPGSDRAYTGLTLVVVTGGTTTLAPPGVRVAGAESVLLLTRVRRHTGELDVLAETRALRELLPPVQSLPLVPPGQSLPSLPSDEQPYPYLLERHLALHRPAYRRVSLALGADDTERALSGSELLERPKSPALLERLFAAGRYHLLSSSGMLPPRLPGLWTGDWNTAWSGAFTTNANLNLQTASAAAAALPEVTGAHAALVHGQSADWRDNARAIFGARGVVAPSHTDGESGHTYHFCREYPLHLWTAGADWLLKPLVDHDETTGGRDPRLAAVLAEVAYFYEDFLSRTGPDGQAVVVPSYSPENRPANGSWGAVNAAMDLSAARHALLTAAAYHPGPDADRWRALAGTLPPHRINDDGRPRRMGLAGARRHLRPPAPQPPVRGMAARRDQPVRHPGPRGGGPPCASTPRRRKRLGARTPPPRPRRGASARRPPGRPCPRPGAGRRLLPRLADERALPAA